MLHAKVTKDGKWQIRNVVLQHQNHEPVPSISIYNSMFHREDLNAVRRRLFQHHDEGVSIPQIHSALAAERNGVENFPVSERQLRNVVDKEKRLKMMEGDANAIAAYFHRMKFENSWNEAIDGYNLGENAWLKGMRSTQRVESMNSFFDKYLKKQTRLYEFVQQYCKAMERRAEDEKQADADSVRFCHQLVSDFPIERVFQKIYTSAKFVEVQQECLKNLYVSVVGCKVVDENVLEYTIEDRVWVRDPTLARTFLPVGNVNTR
ncbi:Protein FAR-RED IMPAIRED RESPONSE 1 [Bienertia sinuspersici]